MFSEQLSPLEPFSVPVHSEEPTSDCLRKISTSSFCRKAPEAFALILSFLTDARSYEVSGGDQVDGSPPAPV
eukprot:997608-Pyramimonas_sp.AAC.1